MGGKSFFRPTQQNHKVLLSDKNLLALINDPKQFIIFVFPHMAPLFLVPSEHFVQKDFPFYKVVRLVDIEAHQARLEKREKKLQEGTLRQTPAASRPTSSSTTCPFTNNKKIPTTRLFQGARTLPSTPPSSPSAFSSSSSSFFSVPSSEPEIGVDQVLPPIVYEEEEEGNMASNLRVEFWERQCKHLFESIAVSTTPSKRDCNTQY